MTTKIEAAVQSLMIRMEVAEVLVATLRVEMVTAQQLERQVAVIEHRLAELTKSQELWGNRGWVIFMVGVTGVVTLLSGAAGALLTFYLNAKRCRQPGRVTRRVRPDCCGQSRID